MQIVIDIPTEMYATLNYIPMGAVSVLEALYAIKNGTPLPKGHGKLIDADAMLSEMKDLKKSPWYKDRTNFAHLPRKEAVQIIEEIIIGNAPTIIEADKEAEDGI